MSIKTDFASALKSKLNARYPILYIQTSEYERIYPILNDIMPFNLQKEANTQYPLPASLLEKRKGIHYNNLQNKIYTWNIVDALCLNLECSRETGVKRQNSQSTNKIHITDPEALMQHIHESLATEIIGKEKINEGTSQETEVDIEELINDSNIVYILEDFHNYLTQPHIMVWLRKLSYDLKYSFDNTRTIIIVSPILNIPKELENFITVLDFPLPNKEELSNVLSLLVSDTNPDPTSEEKQELEPEFFNKLVDSALGMTEQEADLAYALAWSKTKFSEEAVDVVIKEKEHIVRKNGILEFIHTNENINDIGGKKHLKKWLSMRSLAFSPAARAYNLPEPKGLLLLGVPGCGKSLTSKVIASMWNMPLLRLDIGKIYEGIVGSSENNIRTAIKTAEAVAPCVLWIDEIEKGISSNSSGNLDSGVSSRVLSSILTWMQEKTKPVFVVATANNIEALPPELLRKGRFDAIFFVDLPTTKERKEIFEIHLRKKGHNPEDFDLDEFARNSENFNGAEIEECVNEALFESYYQNPQNPSLTNRHILDAISDTVTLATTMEDKIQYLRNWAETRAIPAGEKEQDESNIEISADGTIIESRIPRIKASKRGTRILAAPTEGEA